MRERASVAGEKRQKQPSKLSRIKVGFERGGQEDEEEKEEEDKPESVPSSCSQLVIFGSRMKLTRPFRFD